jgi:hypothetical protein
MSVEELLKIGWLNNPIVDKLYKLGSSGLWIPAEQNAGGFYKTEDRSPMVSTRTHRRSQAAPLP